MTAPLAWLNGDFVDFSQMAVPVWDLGIVAGASLTEMARTFAHRPFRLAEHLNRLQQSCDEIGFELPYPASQLQEIAEFLVTENVKQIADNDDLGIVIFVTAGANPTYLGAGNLPGPTVGVHTFRLPLELWTSAVTEGVKLRIPERRQIHSGSLPVHLKIRNRLHWWLADREAAAVEPGSRALLLDTSDCVTETSAACFYAVIFNQIATPSGDVLNSMSRRMVQEAAEAADVDFRMTKMPSLQLPHITEAFLTSTPVGIMPVQSIDGKPLPVDPEGSTMRMLRDYWKQQTQIDPVQQILNAVS